MGNLRSFLIGTASAGIALMSRTASVMLAAAQNARSGRGSTGQSKATRNKTAQRGDAKRAARRRNAELAYRKQLRKEREIGVHPKHLHSAQRPADIVAAGAAWSRRSHDWDKANG